MMAGLFTRVMAAAKAARQPKVLQPEFELARPASFYAALRRLTGPLSQQQVETTNGILAACGDWPKPWTAYALATAWHEARLIPQREWGRGKGRKYGKPGKYGQVPYGRGLVQITWDYNYEWLDKAASDAGLIPAGAILQDFDLALRPDIAAFALVKGLETGAYHGRRKTIADLIPRAGATFDDYRLARPLVNVMDKAAQIAGYAVKAEYALHEGGWA